MNVDVKIYLAGVKKFFDSNEEDLKNLIPLSKKQEFYKLIELVAESNVEKGEEIPLTQNQYIDICVKLNGVPPKKRNPQYFLKILTVKFFPSHLILMVFQSFGLSISGILAAVTGYPFPGM